jgi:hypothetical protein
VTGVNVPAGVLGASVTVSNVVAKDTLPFTGAALGTYLAVGGGLILTGLALRVLSRIRG